MKYHIDPSKLVIHDKLIVEREHHENGQLRGEYYYLNGKLHNPHGPAIRAWRRNVTTPVEYYFLNGNIVPRMEYVKLALTTR